MSNKQTALGSNVNVTTGTIGAGNITGRTGTTITALIITASGSLSYGTTNVATKITKLETTKQNTLNASSDITVETIDSGNITGRLGTSINSTNIIGTNVFYGPSTDLTNVEDKIGELELNIESNIITTSTNIDCNDIISNDITCKDLTSSTLNVSGVFNMANMVKADNTVITGSQFDTIVIRRPTGVSEFSSNYSIDLREIQVWVNNINVLQTNGSFNVTTLTGMFALWSSKRVDLGYHSTFSPDKIYNNSIETVVGTHWKDPSSDPRVALIRTGYLYRSSWAF